MSCFITGQVVFIHGGNSLSDELLLMMTCLSYQYIRNKYSLVFKLKHNLYLYI